MLTFSLFCCFLCVAFVASWTVFEQDDRNQLMPGQKQGMTYVSRLQSMQAAIDAQLQVGAAAVVLCVVGSSLGVLRERDYNVSVESS